MTLDDIILDSSPKDIHTRLILPNIFRFNRDTVIAAVVALMAREQLDQQIIENEKLMVERYERLETVAKEAASSWNNYDDSDPWLEMCDILKQVGRHMWD